MPIIRGKIFPGIFGAGGQIGVRVLALDSNASTASAKATWAGASAPPFSLDTSAFAAGQITGQPEPITGSMFTLALNSNGSLGSAKPIRAGSVTALALDTSAAADGLLTKQSGAAAATVLALDSSAAVAGKRIRQGATAELDFDSAGSTGGVPDTSVFSPADISSFALWLDAGVGVTTNGSNEVTEWQDQSGNGRNFTPNTGEEPSYNATDPNFNSKPSLEFDAATVFTSGDALRYTGSAIIGDGTQAAAKFFVVRPEPHPANTAFPYTYSEYDSAAPSDLDARNWEMFFDSRSANANRDYSYNNSGSDVDSLGGGSVSDNVTYIVGRAIGTGAPTDLHATAGDRQIIDGDVGDSRNATSARDTTPTKLTSASVIGGRSDDNFGRRFNGQIAEAIIYTKALTKAEANDVIAYLGNKYGITTNTFT